MLGYLVYYPEEAQKNAGYIQMYQREGQKNGIQFSPCSVYEYREKPLPDFVINRTRKAEVSAFYEKKAIPVFHGSQLTKLANHKFDTIQYLKEHLAEEILRETPFPASWYLPAFDSLREKKMERLLQELSQAVIKSVDGHGGNEVFLLKEGEVLPAVLAQKDILLQERIMSPESQDLRVYILGGEIYETVLRKGGSAEFRSNFSLGGSVSQFHLSEEQERFVMEFIKSFPRDTFGIAGMDFLIDIQGRLVFNEIEEMVGARMLYQCTNRDIVKDYVHWLKTFV